MLWMLIVTVRSGKRCCPLDNNRQTLIDFADQYLAPYQIKSCGAEEKLIPELCPLCHGGSHNKDKHTFCLFLNNGTFVCKRGSCGRHGRVEELAKELANTDIKLVRQARTNKSEKQFVAPSSDVFPPTEEIYRYFESRKISRQTVDAMKVGSNFEGNIVFRFFWDGEDVYHKYRIPRKIGPNGRKEWKDSGTKAILYNMDGVVFSQPLILCEGECDALALYEAGLTNVVSVPCGVDNNDWITYCWDWLEKFHTIIIFGDNDAPGRRGVENWTKKLGEYRVLIVRDYPEIPETGQFCKDANEILQKFGPDAIRKAVENAKPTMLPQVLDLADVKYESATRDERMPTGLIQLDENLGGGLAFGFLDILTGKRG